MASRGLTIQIEESFRSVLGVEVDDLETSKMSDLMTTKWTVDKRNSQEQSRWRYKLKDLMIPALQGQTSAAGPDASKQSIGDITFQRRKGWVASATLDGGTTLQAHVLQDGAQWRQDVTLSLTKFDGSSTVVKLPNALSYMEAANLDDVGKLELCDTEGARIFLTRDDRDVSFFEEVPDLSAPGGCNSAQIGVRTLQVESVGATIMDQDGSEALSTRSLRWLQSTTKNSSGGD